MRKRDPELKTENQNLVNLYNVYDAWDLTSHGALLGSSDNKDTRKDEKSIVFFTYQRTQTNKRISIGYLNTFHTGDDESSTS